MLSRWLTTATLGAALFAGPAQAYQPLNEDPETINFGIISTESTMSLKEQWNPMLEDMSEALGMEVEPFFATDYAGIIEAMRFGKVHVAWYGNKSAMEAVDRSGGEIFVQTTDTEGNRGYYSHIIAPADSELESIDDLLACNGSLDFGNGDPNSTSGFLVPGYYVFANNGVDPKECFDTVRNASHGANVMAVANGQIDAATNNNESLGRMAKRVDNLDDKVKVIWTSPMIPSDPLVYREDLSEEMKARIKGFFLNYGRVGPNADEAREVLAGIGDGLGPFVDSNDTQLYPIRELALFKERTQIQNDDTLDAAERKRRVAEIDAQLERLSTLATAEVASDAPPNDEVASAK
jgi:phosphonate transport system substrate-binding protein